MCSKLLLWAYSQIVVRDITGYFDLDNNAGRWKSAFAVMGIVMSALDYCAML